MFSDIGCILFYGNFNVNFPGLKIFPERNEGFGQGKEGKILNTNILVDCFRIDSISVSIKCTEIVFIWA